MKVSSAFNDEGAVIESAAQSGDVPADIPASPVVEPAKSSDGAPAFYRPAKFSTGAERYGIEEWRLRCFGPAR